MKVKVTQPMRQAIQEIMTGCTVSLVKFTPEQYERFVDYDLLRNEQDYNFKTGKFQTIRISYPDEYYAQVRYITTRDLTGIYRECDGTYKSFMDRVRNYCSI